MLKKRLPFTKFHLTLLLPLFLGLSLGPIQSQAADTTKPELFLQVGHAGGVSALAIGPDGRWVASAGQDGTVKIWDVASGRELRNFDGHAEPVMCIAVSPDGKLLASGSMDKTVKIWEAATGHQVRVLPGQPGMVQAIAFSPDGRLLAFAYERMDPPAPNQSSGLKIWEVGTGQEVRSTTGDSNSTVVGLAFTPDSRKLALAHADNISLFDVGTGQEVGAVATRKGRTSALVNGFALSPDGRFVALPGEAGGLNTVEIWDLTKDRKVQSLKGHASRVSAVAFSPDGRLLASASGSANPDEQGNENVVKVWDVASGRALHTLAGHNNGVNAVAFSLDGQWLASASQDGTVKLWDAATGRELRTLVGHTRMVRSVEFTPDGRLLESGNDRTANVWEIRTGRELRVSPLPAEAKIVGPGRFRPGGYLVPLMNRDNSKLTLWEEATGREVISIPRTQSADLFPRSNVQFFAALSPDGRTLALANDEIRRAPGVAQIMTLTQQMQQIAQNTMGSTGKPSKSKMFKNRKEMEQLAKEMMKQMSEVSPGAGESPNPNVPLGAGGRPSPADAAAMVKKFVGKATIKLWASDTGRELYTLEGHDLQVASLAFSRDGRLLATGGNDNTSKIWDLSTGSELHAFQGEAGALAGVGFDIGPASVAFSPDGRLLAASNSNGTISLWEVASGQKLRTLETHAKSDTADFLQAWIMSLAFSEDGRYLASGGVNHTIRLWEVASGREIHTLAASGVVSSLAFSRDGRWLVSGTSDGGTRFWDVQSGELLATLITVGESGDWLVATPDGLFDGSPAAWDLILWRFGGDTFNVAPVEIFFNEFYYPGLLPDILSGKRPRAVADISRIDRRQPRISVSLAESPGAAGNVSSREVRVKIEVAEAPSDGDHPNGSGARDLRLFRNGSLVKIWRGNLSLDNSGKAVLEATVPIVAGENHFTAYAFSHDNIKSGDAHFLVSGANNLRREGTFYVLAVGVNQYANADYNLNFAVADAQALAEEVQRGQPHRGRFANIQVITLFNQEATKANILLALARLAGTSTGPLPPGAPATLENLKPAQPEDALLIYFAGHGAALEPRFYLIPHDLGYTGKRAELDEAGSKLTQAHSISDLDMVQAFEKLDAGNIVLLIDACQSGQALEAEEKRRGPMNSKGLAQLAYEKGMYILTAAQAYQAALEAKELGHGLLTFALVEEGLKTPAADTQPKDGQVEIREWLDYATLRVPQLQEVKMAEAHKQGREITFVEGEEARGDPRLRALQCPRVFYRREPETQPLIVARPATQP